MARHPLRVIICILAALLLLIPVLLGIFGFCLPAQFSHTFLGALPAKVELLRTTQSPRIILVGGSSVPFSVKSHLLEDAFPDYSIVDFGLYADIGTPVMLDLLEEELGEGDIVIISPEQNSQALSLYFSGDSLWQAMDGSFGLLSSLSSHRYEKLAAAFPGFAGKKCYYAIFGSPTPQDIYAQTSFNSYGDIESNLRNYNIIAGGFDPNQTISFFPSVISSDFVEILNDFFAKCQEMGAKVYYRFPPMNRAALEDEAALDGYYDHLNALLDFPILGDPHRSIMESGWFFDTNFHLNDSGATVFTKYLIEDLKILFGDTSVTDIPLPPMPEISGGLVSGDNSQADCFTYRRESGGWIIDGLSEKGRAAEKLTAPTTYQDEAVIGIDPAVFVGNRTLQELTLQENPLAIYDGMFSGCTGLQKLILTGNPSSYTVGDGLMKGADFVILVDPARIDQFRRHYSWQQYSQYIMTT